MKWNRVTEVLPPKDVDLLVWSGYSMFVSKAEYYNMEDLKQWLHPNDLPMFEQSKGRFSEFGQKVYFDNPNIFWMELPEPPK
jgi:hypothetical protein